MGGNKYDATRLISIPDYLFDRLINEKDGENLVALWIRYARQARMQSSEETKSYDGFMREQMGWGEEKFKKAKRALKELGLIETSRTSGGDWVTKVYGEIPTEDSMETHRLETHPLAENQPVGNQPVIDTIVYNKEKKDKRDKKEDDGKEEEKKEISRIIHSFYNVLIEEGIPRKKEANEFVWVTAVRSLLKNGDFLRASSSVGTPEELLVLLTRYGVKDGFWADKVSCLTGICRHWPTIYTQAKAKSFIKPKAKKISEDELRDLISGF